MGALGGQSPRGSSSLSCATEDNIQCLRADVKQRVILAAVRWVDADSAVDEHEALAKLLKGRTGCALGVSSNVGSYEHSRVSLPDSVVDAPPLIEMLPAEARFFLEEFQSRMLLPPEVAAVIQEVTGELGCHDDPPLLSSARSYARLVRQTMKIGLTALTLRPACVLGIFFVKKKENRLRLIVDCRKANALFGPPPSVELLSGDGCRVSKSTLLVLPTESLLACTAGALTLLTVSTGCVSLERFAIFCWPGVSNKYLKMTEIEGIKIEPHQTLLPMCCSLPMDFSWSLYFVQSANRARLNQQPSLRHSVEMMVQSKKVKTHRQVMICMWTTLALSPISFHKFTRRWMRVNRISRDTVFCCTRSR